MSHDSEGFVDALAGWWIWVVRGIAAMLFGILAIAAPASSLLALVMFWGAYAVFDGTLALVLAARRRGAGLPWGWSFFEGLVGLAAGVGTFVWPAVTVLVLLSFIAVRAVMTGIAQIAAAIVLRREIQGEWLLAASGAVSIGFGVLLLARPAAGALALAWMIGGYAFVFGVVLVALGLRLNHWRQVFGHPVPPTRSEA